jgi:23S rRNA C2498 (ribose-2'-O)-methylase RlmM
MEHGGNLEFTKFIFKEQITYINDLLRHLKKEHHVAKKLVAKRENYQKCLSILNGEVITDYDPEIPLTKIRSKLDMYKNMEAHMPLTCNKIIEEIEYVTNLLRNGKS